MIGKVLSRIAIGPAIALASPVLAQDGQADCRFTFNQDGTAEITSGCEEMIAEAGSDAAKANLMFRMAHAMNEERAARSALVMLDRALALEPDNVQYLGERGYTLADLGYYQRALADLDRAEEIEPGNALILNERGWVRQSVGDFAGANADYARLEDASSTELSRLDNHIWLNELDAAEALIAQLQGAPEVADVLARQQQRIDRMRAYIPTGTEAEDCDLSSLETMDAALVYDICTAAFVASDVPADRAEFLIARSTATQIEKQDLSAGYGDLLVAVGIDPDNGFNHSNFGFSLLQVRLSWAARNSFGRALELGLPNDQATAIALGGLAQASFNLGELDDAREQAAQSFETFDNPLALSVLGQVAFETGNIDTAREFWLYEHAMAPGSEDLLQRLAEVGVDDPDAALAALQQEREQE